MEALSRAEILALLDAAYAASERDGLMVLVAFAHGLRASEVLQITRDDLADGFLTVKRLKGSLKTVQPLWEDADPRLNERKRLVEFAALLHGNQRLFALSRQHFWRIFQKHAAAAGIPAHQRHPHVLKHSIAMQTIHDAGVENVRQYLGHKSLSSTGAYLKVSDSEASAAIGRAVGPKT